MDADMCIYKVKLRMRARHKPFRVIQLAPLNEKESELS